MSTSESKSSKQPSSPLKRSHSNPFPVSNSNKAVTPSPLPVLSSVPEITEVSDLDEAKEDATDMYPYSVILADHRFEAPVRLQATCLIDLHTLEKLTDLPDRDNDYTPLSTDDIAPPAYNTFKPSQDTCTCSCSRSREEHVRLIFATGNEFLDLFNQAKINEPTFHLYAQSEQKTDL
jgi:hypothetical protein